MNLNDFQYELPEELIGQEAIEPRDSCRLMVIDRQTKQISHHIFSDLVHIIDENSVLVINDTKVFPARLFGTKETGGKTEILLLRQLSLDSFTCIARGKLKNMQKIIFEEDFWGTIRHCKERSDLPADATHQALQACAAIQIRFNLSGPDLLVKLDKLGKTPLPPYIHSKAKETDLRTQYQTVYAKEKGSAAAPTAGLHFTENLLKNLQSKGVEIEKVTLHVGLGTFKPVTKEQVASKTLHIERFYLSPEVAGRLNLAKKQGRKIIAVGTTTCRVLESQSNEQGILISGEGETNIFIQPGYRYKFIDGLITNFHLPSTSLLMLVTALTCFPNSPAPFTNFQNSLMGDAYREAVKEKYKFFSFGDAMLIL